MQKILEILVELGRFLIQFHPDGFTDNNSRLNRKFIDKAKQIIETHHTHNAWFTPRMVCEAIYANGLMLEENKIQKWLSAYECTQNKNKNIGVVMAGNLPMVGFHDLICVIASGNRLTAKLSSKDSYLIRFITDMIQYLDAGTGSKITLTEEQISGCSAYIATGSNNTSRYFQYYFGKYPHIIRKNRNSAAVILGIETNEELSNLANDIFLYYGLGCRSISKIYFPKGYKPENLFAYFKPFEHFSNHHKWANNYQYNKAVYLVNNVAHLDNGFLLLTENQSLSSPVAVLHYGFYENIEHCQTLLENQKSQLQCVVSHEKILQNSVSFGKSQYPDLWDYADNIDTMKFLLTLE